MNTRSLLSLILLFTTTFDTTLFAAKRPFDEADESEHSSDDDFCEEEEEEDRDYKPNTSSSKCKTGCKKSFIKSGALAQHKRVPSREKPYLCQYCEGTFKQASTRNRHERTHYSRIKSFSCQHCNKSFQNQTCGTKHQKKCTQNPSLSLLSPQQLALDQKAIDNSFLTPTPDPETLSSAHILISLAQADSTQEAQPLPLINLDANCAHILISLMQAKPTQETQLVPLPNLETYNVEHYLQDNS